MKKVPKSKKIKTSGIGLTPDLWDAAKQAATQNSWSVSTLFKNLLVDYLARNPPVVSIRPVKGPPINPSRLPQRKVGN